MDIQENDCSCNRDNSIENETKLNKNKDNGNSLNTIGATYIITKNFYSLFAKLSAIHIIIVLRNLIVRTHRVGIKYVSCISILISLNALYDFNDR